MFIIYHICPSGLFLWLALTDRPLNLAVMTVMLTLIYNSQFIYKMIVKFLNIVFKLFSKLFPLNM